MKPKKLIAITLLTLLAANAPALGADNDDKITELQQKIKDDLLAIEKDNKALRDHYEELERHRTEKADAKAEGDYPKQAGKSIAIGADKTAIQAKKAEKKVDEKILERHKKKLSKAKEDADLDTDAPSSGSNQ